MMPDDPRFSTVLSCLRDYLTSPSTRHIRDPQQIFKFTKKLFDRLDAMQAVWEKWLPEREQFIRYVSDCWIPAEDLLAFFNRLPGPALTLSDVTGRLLYLWENEYHTRPDEDLRGECEAIAPASLWSGLQVDSVRHRPQPILPDKWANIPPDTRGRSKAGALSPQIV